MDINDLFARSLLPESTDYHFDYLDAVVPAVDAEYRVHAQHINTGFNMARHLFAGVVLPDGVYYTSKTEVNSNGTCSAVFKVYVSEDDSELLSAVFDISFVFGVAIYNSQPQLKLEPDVFYKPTVLGTLLSTYQNKLLALPNAVRASTLSVSQRLDLVCPVRVSGFTDSIEYVAALRPYAVCQPHIEMQPN